MRARPYALIAALAGAASGCGRTAPLAASFEASLDDDVVYVAPSTSPAPLREALTSGDGDGGAHLVYVHFDGLTLAPGPDDPHTGRSVIVGRTTTIPPFDARPYLDQLDEEKVRARIVTRVKQHFAPFSVEVLRARPPAGVHHTICIVGGLPSLVGQPSRTAGLSPLDCDDRQPDNVVFIFSEVLRPEATGSVDMSIDAIAIACSHEAGHALGLGHTSEVRDVMAPRISRAVEGFAGESAIADDGSATCVRNGRQDSQRLLAATVGRMSTTGPDVTFLGLEEGGRVPSRFEITASAIVPGETVRAVEIWADGRRVAVSEWPPYRARIEAESGRPLSLYAAARGDDGLLGEATVSLLVDDAAPAPEAGRCRVHADCPSDTSCIDGACRAPAFSPATTPAGPDDGTQRSGLGCAAAGSSTSSEARAPIGAAILAACIALLLFRLRRRRAG